MPVSVMEPIVFKLKDVSILLRVAVRILPFGTFILGNLTSPETVSLCIGFRIAQLSPLV